MRSRASWLLVFAAFVLGQVVLAGETSVLVTMGLRDTRSLRWQGKVGVTGGKLVAVQGWLFRSSDVVGTDGTFRFVTDPIVGLRKPRCYPKGLLVTLTSGPGTRLTVTTGALKWTIDVAKLRFGVPVVHSSGTLAAQLAPTYTRLSTGQGEDDYPDVCRLQDGSLVAVWQSYAEGQDRLMWAKRQGGSWSQAQEIPGLIGDLYQPKCVGDGRGGVWVVCAARNREDFDLYALHYDGRAWGRPVNISHAKGNDFNQALARDAAGTIYCVWQGYRGGSSDILLARCVGGSWQAPLTVAGTPANEWQPAICTGPAGTWVAWDTYQNGSYDVYIVYIVDGQGEKPRAIAASARFEAKASLAQDRAGRVFIAWQDAGEKWGKDTGYTVPKEQRGQAIYRERNIRVACIEGDRLFMAPDVAASMPAGKRTFLENPRLACSDDGRLWLFFRRPVVFSRPAGKRVWREKAWENYATFLAGNTWAPALYFPDKMARIDTYPALAPLGQGVAVVFHTDGRQYPRVRQMTHNRVFATELAVNSPPAAPAVAEVDFPQPVRVGGDEVGAVVRARQYRVKLGGRSLRLFRGDLHRHTEISWDGNGDGSILDTYRYAIDAAALDYLMVSDHNQLTGVDLEYIRWRSYKLADVFNHPPAFTTLFGYERSVSFPQGHRNVVRASRDYPSFRHTGQQDDQKLLYDYCRKYGAIVIPHTTGSNHGTRWLYYDRALEPVAEIFQGCRTNYEYEGAPKSASPGDRQAQRTGYQPEGFLWRAWQRNLRLGIIASSDHGSTHYSYACVYADEPTREKLVDALRARHTFGATDNIVIRVSCGPHFMGDEWQQKTAPVLNIEVLGTAPIARLVIVRDFKFVYTSQPNNSTVNLQWMDNDFTPGTHMYYVRVEQSDQSLAWGSPMWITKG